MAQKRAAIVSALLRSGTAGGYLLSFSFWSAGLSWSTGRDPRTAIDLVVVEWGAELA